MQNDLETIKVTMEAIKATAEFGKDSLELITAITKEPLEQVAGIFADKLKFYRFKRQLDMMSDAMEILTSRGLDRITRPVPLKEFIPFLEYSSLEDDSYLSEKWSILLANAADETRSEQNNMAFIEILKSISPLEAKILEKIYSLPDTGARYSPISTLGLPHSVIYKNDIMNEDAAKLTPDVIMALNNLDRLRCLTIATAIDGNQILGGVHQTSLGRKFVEACTR